MNKIIDEVNSGKGTVGKFLKDPTLYDNANKTDRQANQLIADINAGKGTLGKLAKDEALAKKMTTPRTQLTTSPTASITAKAVPASSSRIRSLYNNTNALLVETRNLIKRSARIPRSTSPFT